MTFELKKGDLRATARSLGGELVSLQDRDGLEYIWQGDPAFWAGQNPILFPIVGSLKDGRVDIGGKTCEMSRHGFARGLDFTPVDQGEDFVTLALGENGQTLEQYPFPFSLKVTHRLLEDGFSTTFTVKNTGTTPMPFCIGAHTAIRCPSGRGSSLRTTSFSLRNLSRRTAICSIPRASSATTAEGPCWTGAGWPWIIVSLRRWTP